MPKDPAETPSSFKKLFIFQLYKGQGKDLFLYLDSNFLIRADESERNS